MAKQKQARAEIVLTVQSGFDTKIIGVTFTNADGSERQNVIRKFVKEDTPLLLLPEPDNPADADAVGVWVEHKPMLGKKRKYQLGYLGKTRAKQVKGYWASGRTLRAYVLNVTGGSGDKPARGVNMRVLIE